MIGAAFIGRVFAHEHQPFAFLLAFPVTLSTKHTDGASTPCDPVHAVSLARSRIHRQLRRRPWYSACAHAHAQHHHPIPLALATQIPTSLGTLSPHTRYCQLDLYATLAGRRPKTVLDCVSYFTSHRPSRHTAAAQQPPRVPSRLHRHTLATMPTPRPLLATSYRNARPCPPTTEYAMSCRL